MESNRHAAPPPRERRPRHPRRRRSKLGMFFTLLGVVAFGVLLLKYVLVPVLVWVQSTIGGAV